MWPVHVHEPRRNFRMTNMTNATVNNVSGTYDGAFAYALGFQ